MGEWPVTTIGKLGEVFDGPHATPKTVSEGPIFLGIGALQDGRINLGETRHVTPEDYEKWTRRVRPQAGDVVFSYETRIGQAAIIPEGMQCCLGRRMGLVRVDRKKILPRFFLFAYISPEYQEFLRSRTIHGATVDRILLTEFPNFPFPCPPIELQEHIVSLLGALDDKIELNRRTNETLEAIARTTFKDWFVDFGPTRAKMEDREPYLAPELWAIFPDRLNDATSLPEGWTLGTLTDLAALSPESWSASRPPAEIAYVDLANTKWGNIDKIEHYTWENAPSRARRVLRPRDVIIGTVRPGNGSYALIGEDGLTGSTGFAVLRPHQARDFALIWCAATSPENIDRLAHLADGAAYPAVRPEVVAQTQIVISGAEALDAFAKQTSDLFDLITVNKREVQNLAITRDILLPKLMSGEIRLRDAEKIIGGVL